MILVGIITFNENMLHDDDDDDDVVFVVPLCVRNRIWRIRHLCVFYGDLWHILCLDITTLKWRHLCWVCYCVFSAWSRKWKYFSEYCIQCLSQNLREGTGAVCEKCSVWGELFCREKESRWGVRNVFHLSFGVSGCFELSEIKVNYEQTCWSHIQTNLWAPTLAPAPQQESQHCHSLMDQHKC